MVIYINQIALFISRHHPHKFLMSSRAIVNHVCPLSDLKAKLHSFLFMDAIWRKHLMGPIYEKLKLNKISGPIFYWTSPNLTLMGNGHAKILNTVENNGLII